MFVLMEVFRDEEYKTRKVVPSVEALEAVDEARRALTESALDNG